MVEPSNDEKVGVILSNVTGIWGLAGLERQYDIMFADNGVAFVVVASGLKMAARAAGAGAFGAVGAAAAGAFSGNKSVRKQFEGLTLPEIMRLNEKSFYVPYPDVKQVSVKKGTLVTKMNFELPEGKFRCQFPKTLYEIAQQAVMSKLATKMLDEA